MINWQWFGWWRSWITIALLVAPAVAQLPAAPSHARKWEDGHIASKKFLAVHSAYLASIAFDVETTHQALAREKDGLHHCVEGNPSLGFFPTRAAMYKWPLISLGLFTFVDASLQWFRVPVAPYVAPAWEMERHISAGVHNWQSCF